MAAGGGKVGEGGRAGKLREETAGDGGRAQRGRAGARPGEVDGGLLRRGAKLGSIAITMTFGRRALWSSAQLGSTRREREG